ncbi:MAG: hypothetical protein IJE65_01870 [Clostridia bacterium]|nr:hypothetical protein [Clostridia bacterium]
MKDIGSALVSVSVVSVFISVLSLCFPNNKYRSYLIMLSKIIIILLITISLTSVELNFDFNKCDIVVNNNVYENMINETVKKDIDTYIESVYDTKCDTEITDSEVILSITNGNANQIKNSVFDKFGIECRVIKIE